MKRFLSCLWIIRLPVWEKLFGHWSQAKGFSFECIRLWTLKRLWLGNLFLHVSHLCSLIDELDLNLFESGINNGLSWIADEHVLLSLTSFVWFWRSIEISFKFVTFDWMPAAPSQVESLSIRWFITFTIDFLAFSMFDEKSIPFLPLFNFLTFFEIKNFYQNIWDFKLSKIKKKHLPIFLWIDSSLRVPFENWVCPIEASSSLCKCIKEATVEWETKWEWRLVLIVLESLHSWHPKRANRPFLCFLNMIAFFAFVSKFKFYFSAISNLGVYFHLKSYSLIIIIVFI